MSFADKPYTAPDGTHRKRLVYRDPSVREEPPAYWGVNRWGQPALRRSLQDANTSGKSRAGPSNQPFASAKQASAAVNALERKMTITLAALARFDDDERRIVTRALQRHMGRGPLNGLITLPHFVDAWSELGVEVPTDVGEAMFLKYGTDEHGYMPLDVFVQSLLAGANRRLSMSDTQRRPYQLGGPYEFDGRIVYRPCRKGVYPPSSWTDTGGTYGAGGFDQSSAVLGPRSDSLPRAGLSLHFIYGYAGKTNTAPNLYFTCEAHKVVYYTAAVGIVYDTREHTQTFYQEHNDDIKCLALESSKRRLVATGQVASKTEKGHRLPPYVNVWDVLTRKTLLKLPVASPDRATPYVMVCAVAFSVGGKLLAVCMKSGTGHTVMVFKLRAVDAPQHLGPQSAARDAARQAEERQLAGQRPLQAEVVSQLPNVKDSLFGIKFNDVRHEDRKNFLVFGSKHISVNTWSAALKNHTMNKLQFAKAGTPDDVMSAIWLGGSCVGHIATGHRDGSICLWDRNKCLYRARVHAPGVPMPDDAKTDGTKVHSGVRCLILKRNGASGADKNVMVSGGADGSICEWDLSGGVKKLSSDLRASAPNPLTVHRIESMYAGEAPAAFRSLDSHPTSGYVAGTHRCDVWYVDESPSSGNTRPMIYGHTADLYACDWHPDPSRKVFATASESSMVFIWDAENRRVLKKVNVEYKCRSCAFSPDGSHLAVGCKRGTLRVIVLGTLDDEGERMRLAHDEKVFNEAIDEIKYSPNGARLAVGSHDNFIDIFVTPFDAVGRRDGSKRDGYRKIARCSGHSSYVTHLDWSIDSTMLQSNDGAYELLYWDGNTGKQIAKNQRDTTWATWTCTLGFPVMGIWPDGSDGTDVNSVCRSNDDAHVARDARKSTGRLLVTTDDSGMVNLFTYPSVVEDGPCRRYFGHSSHVMMARFSPDDRYVVTVGGHDRAVFQWSVDPVAIEPPKPLLDFSDVQVFRAKPPSAIPEAAPVMAMAMDGKTQVASDGVTPAAGKSSLEKKIMRPAKPEPPKVKYEVSVVTSDLKGAGTSASVSMIIYGAKGHSKLLRLEKSADDFKRGTTFHDTILSNNLGMLDGMKQKVTSLRITHDNSGSGPSWHLASVRVTCQGEDGGPAFDLLFPYDNWLDDAHNTLSVTLFPRGSAPVRNDLVYELVLSTAKAKGSGTDARVFVNFSMADGTNTGEMELSQTKDDFERGKKDVFQVRLPPKFKPTSELKAITIGHDNTGDSPGWLLDDVILSQVGTAATGPLKAGTLTWDVNKWLEHPQLSITLMALDGVPSKRRRRKTKYSIEVVTSDIRGAGTDAEVYVTLHGVFDGNQVSGTKHFLSNAKENFDRDRRDEFYITELDCGQLSRLTVGHNSKGSSPGWHLKYVVVTNIRTNGEEAEGRGVGSNGVPPTDRFVFLCDKWLDSTEGDRKTERVLDVVSAEDMATMAVLYRITIQTSDKRGAGTDANVYCKLIGEKRSTDIIKLDNGGKNNFERGMTDCFNHECASVGKLKALVIGHDNHGLMAGWHCSYAEVTDEFSGDNYFFNCNKWLEKSSEAGVGTEYTLPVTDRNADAEQDTYVIRIKTGDRKGAGTDANVFIVLNGPKGSTKKTLLDSSANDFQRNELNTFELRDVTNVGNPVQSIRLGHDGFGFGSSWFCESVKIYSVNYGATTTYLCNRWFGGDAELEATLLPTSGDGVDGTASLSKYRVTIYTSDLKGAGTDATVFCQICNPAKNLRTGVLKCDTSANNFERGGTDVFHFQDIDVEHITELLLYHDNKGLGPGWHCRSVSVVNTTTGDQAEFPCGKWFDASVGDKQIRRTLVAASESEEHKYKYRISIFTGDKRGAGTNANVSFTLHGADANGNQTSSGKLTLDAQRSSFERNTEDEFLVDLATLPNVRDKELGTLSMLKLEHDGAGDLFGNSEWYVSHVKVRSLAKEVTTTFTAECWIKKNKPVTLKANDPTAMKDPNSEHRYEVVVHTSDRRGAGTDSNISIELFGKDAGQASNVLKLDTSEDNFERGKLDRFVVPSKNLGASIDRIRLHSDGFGLFKRKWHCSSVEVTDMSDESVPRSYFTVDKWFDPGNPMSMSQVFRSNEAKLSGAPLVIYEISCRTGDMRGAGTDAVVSIQLFDTKGKSTMPHVLESSANDFKRNATDKFYFEDDGIAEFSHCVVQHDGSGLFGNDWFLEDVEIHIREKPPASQQTDPSSGNTLQHVFCAHHDWVKAKTPVRLEAGGVRDAGVLGQMSTYHISVTTSNVRGAGTDANVFCRLHGPLGDTGELTLESSADDFKRNTTQTFVVQARSVGDSFTQLDLWHDGAWFGSAWRVDSVHVINTSLAGVEAAFVIERWLDEKEGRKVEALPEGAGKPRPKRLEYEIAVVTSDIRWAGTGSNAFIRLHGSSGKSTGELALECRENFDRATRREVRVTVLEDLGPLTAVTLRHDDSGNAITGDDWAVREVEVTDLADAVSYHFPCHDTWLKRLKSGSEDGLSHTFYASGTEEAKKLAEQRKTSAYTIRTFTSTIRHAGTDSTVMVNLRGPDANRSLVRKLENARNNFESGQEDVFSFDIPVNEDPLLNPADHKSLALQYISLELKPWTLDFGSAWHLDHIEVTHFAPNGPVGGTSYRFDCRAWFERPKNLTKHWDANSTSPGGLTPVTSRTGGSSATGAMGKFPWSLTFYTADEMWSGTDARVSITLVGDGGRSATPILDQQKSHFERASVDTFEVLLSQPVAEEAGLGGLAEVQLSHDGGGSGSDWIVSGVVAMNRNTKKTFAVLPNLDNGKRGKGSELLKKKQELKWTRIFDVSTRYIVTVATGNDMWAGTNDDISLDLVEVREGTDVILWQDILACLPATVVRRKGAFDKGHVTPFEVGREDFVPWGNHEPKLAIVATLAGGDKWQVSVIKLEEVATGREFSFEPDGGPAWLSSKVKTARLVGRETKQGVAREQIVATSQPQAATAPSSSQDDSVASDAPKTLPEGWEVTRFTMGGSTTEYYSNPSTGETANSIEEVLELA